MLFSLLLDTEIAIPVHFRRFCFHGYIYAGKRRLYEIVIHLWCIDHSILTLERPTFLRVSFVFSDNERSYPTYLWSPAKFIVDTSIRCLSLKFPPQQVRDHLSASDPGGPPQRWKVQSTRQCIRVSKTQHRRDPPPCVLEREARVVHLILFDCATT